MSANVLKMIALITMTIDHVGFMLFPDCEWMRIIGRISFPIFAFMIAEGCRYTHNRFKYLLRIAVLGIGMQIVLFVADRSLYQSVFISFTLAIILIYTIDKANDTGQLKYWVYAAAVMSVIGFLCLCLPVILRETDYDIDYNIVGVLIPVVCYFAEDKKTKIAVFFLGLVALSVFYGGIQWFCLSAVILVALYNNQRGKYNFKNLFYFYYPAHLAVIYVIKMLMNS